MFQPWHGNRDYTGKFALGEGTDALGRAGQDADKAFWDILKCVGGGTLMAGKWGVKKFRKTSLGKNIEARGRLLRQEVKSNVKSGASKFYDKLRGRTSEAVRDGARIAENAVIKETTKGTARTADSIATKAIEEGAMRVIGKDLVKGGLAKGMTRLGTKAIPVAGVALTASMAAWDDGKQAVVDIKKGDIRNASVDIAQGTTKAVGAVGGAAAVGYAGAVIGSFICPGVGTAIGGVVGGAVGAWFGEKSARVVTDPMERLKKHPEIGASISTARNIVEKSMVPVVQDNMGQSRFSDLVQKMKKQEKVVTENSLTIDHGLRSGIAYN